MMDTDSSSSRRLTPSTEKKHRFFHLASENTFFGKKIIEKVDNKDPVYSLLRACDVLSFLAEKHPATFTRQELSPIITSFGYEALGIGDTQNGPTSPISIADERIEKSGKKYTVSEDFLKNSKVVISFAKDGYESVWLNYSNLSQAILSSSAADSNDFSLERTKINTEKKKTAASKKATKAELEKQVEALKVKVEALTLNSHQAQAQTPPAHITIQTANPVPGPVYGYPSMPFSPSPMMYMGQPFPQVVMPYGMPYPAPFMSAPTFVTPNGFGSNTPLPPQPTPHFASSPHSGFNSVLAQPQTQVSQTPATPTTEEGPTKKRALSNTNSN